MSLKQIAYDFENLGITVTPQRLRDAANGPWNFPKPDTKVLVKFNKELSCQRVRGPAMSRTGQAAIVTWNSYILPLSHEGIMWKYGWDVTPEFLDR